MQSSDLSKRMSDGLEIDPNSPDIVGELLEATTEWQNIQEIVKLTFKGVLQVLKSQSDSLKDLQMVVQSKAGKQEMHSMVQQKANLIDMKKTMAEVAANIESRTSYDDVRKMLEEKITKHELNYAL
jgi:hypothetical protein